MTERPRFFDDLAGVAGGALSAFSGLRDEMAALIRARIDEAIRKLDVVRREEFEAMAELAAKARAETELLAARVAALEAMMVPAAPRGVEPLPPQSNPAPELPPETDHG
ncbi:accessory factor UbiK family protein [Acidiphilium sp. AL]|uniref:Accessory factor UbiK family protein n=1 Tax=Acidiphilium iwatense TaxID=768198 RepID=A0ABS9DT43_9PROT|nr:MULTISPECIES: accessory factor UbiK family protein [Acidiphilium]MCF3945901.1 accessory factor UbiK family protein [Acidiphilium iwatense]MCU4159218.1 accessory factor UbiK family protein [Acidiphilium sp. AL]